MNKHQVTDKNGTVHKRVSQNRSYAFAVVRHYEAYEFDLDGQGKTLQIPAGTSVKWAGNRELAEKTKRTMWASWPKHTTDIEIIEVQK